jgi:hypothetical protein
MTRAVETTTTVAIVGPTKAYWQSNLKMLKQP